jgi:hypothetical protein
MMTPSPGARATYLSLAVVLFARPLIAQVNSRCEASAPAGSSAEALLRRASEVTGLAGAADQVLHIQAIDSNEQLYQSDRNYLPYLAFVATSDLWLDPATGAVRSSTLSGMGMGNGSAGGPARQAPALLTTARASFMVTDSSSRPAPGAVHGNALDTRALEVWAVLADWRNGPAPRLAGRCWYRDYWRTVLARTTPGGEERLYIDAKTGFPVKLERMEPHYLWGARRIEYVYTTYQHAGSSRAVLPIASFRIADGQVEIARQYGTVALAPRAGSPSVAIPDTALTVARDLAGFLQPSAPDTVRVSERAFLLRNPGYTQGIVFANDTVVVLDATQGEARARQDSAWIAKLFPGKHATVVVVTDMAWPHIAGVRFWVANGATVVTHRASADFMRKVIDRRWTLKPDLLEQRRAAAKLELVTVTDSLRLAGGAVRVYPIDGIGSEGAVMAWLPQEKFLWASDYIQTLRSTSSYANEVWAATRRVGIVPERTAAQHLPMTAWATIDSLAKK